VVRKNPIWEVNLSMRNARTFLLLSAFLVSCSVLSGCSARNVPKNINGIANNSANEQASSHAPELNVGQPLIPGSLTKVSGWVPGDTGAEVRIDGPTVGSGYGLTTQKNGHFSGTVLVPDNVPPGGSVTVQLMVGSKTLIKDKIEVTNPYLPQKSVELHLLH